MQKSGFIAIAGRPNAGKSTLLNRVLGAELSIVTPKAQTTRERVLGILTEEQGQIVFVDTPGIHTAKEGGLNAYMVEEAIEALKGASAVWYIVDPTSRLEHERVVMNLLLDAKLPVFLLFNKTDLYRHRPGVEAFREILGKEAQAMGLDVRETLLISAKEGMKIKDLVSKTWEILPEGPLYYPDPEQLSDRPTRFFVAEKIREQLLLQLGEEVPYSCAVEIAKFDENSKPPRIEAVIHVERESQKGIVVGKGGSRIKTIGQAARKEIEKFIGAHVFLGLQVKLYKDWSKDALGLKRLGYNVPEARNAKRGKSA